MIYDATTVVVVFIIPGLRSSANRNVVRYFWTCGIFARSSNLVPTHI